MDRFSTKGPNEKYPLPFEPDNIRCGCGRLAEYKHETAGETCGQCLDEVLEEYDLEIEEMEEL